MGMPSISITFTEIAATAIKRGERGIIAMILKDAVPAQNPVSIVSEDDIPADLSEFNKEQIRLALIGYINAPRRVLAYVLPADAEAYSDAFAALRTYKFDYLVVPTAATDGLESSVVSYVTAERASDRLIKAVLPDQASDREGIINYATPEAIKDDTVYPAEKYCSRIAGIIAGTPLYMSCTYAPLAELTDCTRLTRAEMDAAVDAGKFIIWWDGEKVKTGRAVNSLVTLTGRKNTQFQKIKILDAMDMITNDIRMTVEDSYIGKYANSYDNKCLLLSAIGNYFDQLITDGVIQDYTVEIDIDANRSYLKGRGRDVEAMSEDELKKANTGSFVFLKARLSMLDAIEDVVLPISI